MQRSIKVSLGLATKAKRHRLSALLREVRGCIQRYIDLLWTSPGKLDAETLNKVPGGSLSYRHRSNCLKVALETVVATRLAARETGRWAKRPVFKGAIRLSSLVAKIERGKGSFDYVLKVSGIKKGDPVVIPFKSHKRLNHWLGKPGAELLRGCTLGDGWAALWIGIPVAEIPRERILSGKVIAVDIGKNKMLVDSDGNRHGAEMKAVCDRVGRAKPGSKGRLRASRARRDYINRKVKELPWDKIAVVGHEDLKNLKRGKKKNRGKSFRKAMAPWVYRQAVRRIDQLAEENRVLSLAYDPRDTSRGCPDCGTVASENRKGELFRCVGPQCNRSGDADDIAALNGLARTYRILGAVYGRPAPPRIAS